MASPVTRRRFVQASAAAAAGAALEGGALAPGVFAQRPDGPNVLLVIVDSLRADAVYESWVRTPTMDALARQGLRFTNVFPEGMPTVPARNAILSGRRQFPFRGWYDRPGLIQAPGWEPLDHVEASFLSVLRRAGWWTAYVTDNPFLGYAPPYGRFRGSVNRFVRTGGQIGGHQPVSSVPREVLRHWLHPANDDSRTRRRVGLYLANSRPWESPDNTFAGRVFRNAIHELNQAARAARSLCARRGHLRAARALDAARALPRSLRRLGGARARDAAVRPRGDLAQERPARPRASTGCATSTPPR